MTTYVLHYDGAHIRARVVGDEALWFIRDVVAAAGVRLLPGPLPQPTPYGLMGLSSTGQVETVLHALGYTGLDAFKEWAKQSGERLTAPTGVLQLFATGPHHLELPGARKPRRTPPPARTA